MSIPWEQDRNMVLHCLEELEKKMGSIDKKIDRFTETSIKIQTELAVLKTKVAFIGFIAGIISGGAVTLIIRLTS